MQKPTQYSIPVQGGKDAQRTDSNFSRAPLLKEVKSQNIFSFYILCPEMYLRSMGNFLSKMTFYKRAPLVLYIDPGVFAEID